MAPTLAMKVRTDGSPAVLLTYRIDDGRRAVCEMFVQDGERKYRYLVVAADGKSATEYISDYTHQKLTATTTEGPSLPPFSTSDLAPVLDRLSYVRNKMLALVFIEAPGFPSKEWVLNPPLPASEAGEGIGHGEDVEFGGDPA